MNKATVITCIGRRVQETMLQFGQNHQQSPYFGYMFLPFDHFYADKGYQHKSDLMYIER